MSFKLVMAILADVHQVVMVQRYFRLVDVAAVKVYFVVHDVAGPFPADLAQAAVLLYAFSYVCAAAASPLFGCIKFLSKIFHISPAKQTPP